MSILAVVTYAFFMAPDVALAEAMVGALLMTFVYVLLLRTPGTLRIGYVPTPILFEERPYGYDGLEYEIVKRYASVRGYEVEYIKFEDRKELIEAFEEEYVDIACGPFVGDSGILETVVFELDSGRTIDFLSMSDEKAKILKRRKAEYVILSRDEDFRNFIDDFKKSEDFSNLIERFTGGWI